jgi:hypothetical protein
LTVVLNIQMPRGSKSSVYAVTLMLLWQGELPIIHIQYTFNTKQVHVDISFDYLDLYMLIRIMYMYYLHECVWCIHRVTGCPRPPFAKSSACSLQILYSGSINMIVYWRFRQHIRTLHFEVTNSTNSWVKCGLHCIIDSWLRSAKCCMSNAQGMYMPVPDKVFFIATFQHVKSEKTWENRRNLLQT